MVRKYQSKESMVFLTSESIQEDFRLMRDKLYSLESHIYNVELQFQREREILHTQIMRLKNGDELTDDYIIKGLAYLDLSPEKAFKKYNENDSNFFLLDVSESGHKPLAELPEVYKIPLEDLEKSRHNLPGLNHSIFVISEKGVRSIRACKILQEMGFSNLNNISGGYKFWAGFRRQDESQFIPDDFSVA